jgi:hypothetical protein
MSAVSITPFGWHLRRPHSQRRQVRQLTCPVGNQSRVEFYINLKSAKALGITVPLPLSGRADEVIE